MEDIYISKNRNQPREIEFDFLNETPPPMPPQNEKPKKEKKKHRFLKIIAIALVLIFLFTWVFIFMFAAMSGYTRNDLESNKYASAFELKSSPFVSNILLLGVDGKADSSSRSDSMILVSVDFAHMKIKLTSFLRDSWVEIPSKGKKAKLNSACSSGGPQLVVDTIEYNFGVDIDHYVMVDFNMFTQIIDSLGGVTVEVTKKEAKFKDLSQIHHSVSSSLKNIFLQSNKKAMFETNEFQPSFEYDNFESKSHFTKITQEPSSQTKNYSSQKNYPDFSGYSSFHVLVPIFKSRTQG